MRRVASALRAALEAGDLGRAVGLARQTGAEKLAAELEAQLRAPYAARRGRGGDLAALVAEGGLPGALERLSPFEARALLQRARLTEGLAGCGEGVAAGLGRLLRDALAGRSPAFAGRVLGPLLDPARRADRVVATEALAGRAAEERAAVWAAAGWGAPPDDCSWSAEGRRLLRGDAGALGAWGDLAEEAEGPVAGDEEAPAVPEAPAPGQMACCACGRTRAREHFSRHQRRRVGRVRRRCGECLALEEGPQRLCAAFLGPNGCTRGEACDKRHWLQVPPREGIGGLWADEDTVNGPF